MTNLFEFTCVMHVRNRTCQTLVACSRPLRDGTNEQAHLLTTKHQVYQFEPSTGITEPFERILSTILQQIQISSFLN